MLLETVAESQLQSLNVADSLLGEGKEEGRADYFWHSYQIDDLGTLHNYN
jgi:hypothetical protein